jgi:hypothetical protein
MRSSTEDSHVAIHSSSSYNAQFAVSNDDYLLMLPAKPPDNNV